MTLRPADANEVVEAWKVIMKLRKEPVALILTRQAVPTFDRTKYASAAGLARGAYILADAEGGKPQVILMATGSEVYLCIDAYEKLKRKASGRASSACLRGICSSIRIRVYRERCCRPTSPRGSRSRWLRLSAGRNMRERQGRIIGMHTFGASAPLKDLQKKFGFTSDAVLQAARELLGK